MVTCKTTSGTLALYELSELSVYPYDFEQFNEHSKKMNDYVNVYPIQVRLNCILCLRMKGKYMYLCEHMI
ncbi:hypothetical protein F383_06910 [Gossypium arboreum]|uniref:Uncharacterized protein n=1 Tax=Gossypium arboreum TaxID=29729 RepID=A0A0B0P6E0_GOSAR|nr:hypothetical protein F383_06910 [Gossypium arboreum]